MMDNVQHFDKPHYIAQQHNTNCQQFFGPVTGCIFAMPGANVSQHPTAPAASEPKPSQPATPRKSRPKVSVVRKSQKTPKTAPAPLVEMTFRKNGILNGHISLLYDSLIKNHWISSPTTEDDFQALFSASSNDCRIIWSGKYGKGTLVYLFCQLIAEDLISLDRGFTLSRILEAHFVDTNGQPLTNLDHGDPFNEQAVPAVKQFIHEIKISLGRRSRSVQTEPLNEFTDASGYGYDIDSFDHQDLHLHNRHGSR